MSTSLNSSRPPCADEIPRRKPYGQAELPRLLGFKRVVLAAATAFITVNIWTGCPVLAVWVGSRIVGQRQLSMTAVGVVVVALGAVELAMLLVLAWLNNRYDELTGRPRAERRAAWLRSMSASEAPHVSQRVGITVLERIVILNVYIAVIALLVWWVFVAGHAFVA
jgi:hypothetical protein